MSDEFVDVTSESVDLSSTLIEVADIVCVTPLSKTSDLITSSTVVLSSSAVRESSKNYGTKFYRVRKTLNLIKKFTFVIVSLL